MNAINWKNWTDEDFSWKFNGVEHSFPKGMEIYMESDKAEHFTKHLVDREMNKLKVPTSNAVVRADLSSKCYPVSEPVTPEVAIDLNEKKKIKKTKKVDEEFPDLKK